ncbi:MAG: LemA family protein [Clostridia bacterium]
MALYIIICIMVCIIILAVVYTLVTYNTLIKSNDIVEETFSTMDVYLKKRWDLIPNLVEVVKGYAENEKETLNEITSLRDNTYFSMSMNKKINVNEQLTQGISEIMAISENYPELKASENFLKLSSDLREIEEQIDNSRKYYNEAVRALNDKIQNFPGSVVANIFSFKQANMFEASKEENERLCYF